jgi:small multidrug resistance pump
MVYFYLALAVISETIATSALKATEEFTRFWPSMVVLVGYSIAFYMMTIVMRTLPVGITYAIWSGVGIVLVSLIGFVWYKQTLDLPGVIGIVLIIAGVAVIHLFSKSAA